MYVVDRPSIRAVGFINNDLDVLVQNRKRLGVVLNIIDNGVISIAGLCGP